MGFFIEATTYGTSEASEHKLYGRNNPEERLPAGRQDSDEGSRAQADRLAKRRGIDV